MKSKILYFLIICWLSKTCQIYATNSITISGSSTIKSILNHYESLIEQQSGIRINLISRDSKQGIEDLVHGYADLAVITTPLSYLSNELPGIDITKLRPYPLGRSSITFITHPSNPIQRIDLKQVKSILNGRVVNWKELGGIDENIMIVTEFPGGGIRTEIEQKLLNKPFAIPVKTMENISQVKEVVSSVSYALGIVSSTVVDSTVNILDTNINISQPIILVTKPNPDKRVRSFVDALKVIKLQEVY